MLCDNCGENEANCKYTQIINGEKKEMMLCEKCSKEMGIAKMDFSMPISFSSFLDDFFKENDTFLPSFIDNNTLKCEQCGMTFDEFLENGKFGCENCYSVFSSKIDPILKNIHGGNRHIGRKINTMQSNINKQDNIKPKKENKELEELQLKLKQAISSENYEEAAIIRDKIKNIEKGE